MYYEELQRIDVKVNEYQTIEHLRQFFRDVKKSASKYEAFFKANKERRRDGSKTELEEGNAASDEEKPTPVAATPTTHVQKAATLPTSPPSTAVAQVHQNAARSTGRKGRGIRS